MKPVVLVILVVGLAHAQLNYEGNPLTENTDYTAEESHFSQRTARREEATANVVNRVTESTRVLHPVTEKSASLPANIPGEPGKPGTNSTKPAILDNVVAVTQSRGIVSDAPRQFVDGTYNRESNSIDRSELALSTFLNSKTPEESRLSLDHYLQSSGTPQSRASQIVPDHRTDRSTIISQQQQQQRTNFVPQVGQSSMVAVPSSPVNQFLTAQLVQRQQLSQPIDQFYDPGVNSHPQQVPANVGGMQQQQQMLLQQQMLQQPPYGPMIQSRNDVFYPGAWYNRVRRIRKPMPFPQPRLGPGVYNGPVPGPFKPKPPIEVIYTKPPGFHHGPPPIANPPVAYEDASGWFPESDHPPPPKDVYYSQLYAQSYDPHYYNYIAQTGKIKPHLYGKLGKYHEDQSGGIWAELFRGFTKHGLKNMMNPTFLLGMTLPIVTLMISALVQKRSLSRSGSRDFSNRDDSLQEYLERLQRAMECYEKVRRKRDASVDECLNK